MRFAAYISQIINGQGFLVRDYMREILIYKNPLVQPYWPLGKPSSDSSSYQSLRFCLDLRK